MITHLIFILLFSTAYLAILTRMHGWGGFKGCREISEIGTSAVFGLCTYLISDGNWYWTLATAAGAYGGLSLGNADGFLWASRYQTLTTPVARFLARKIMRIKIDTPAYDMTYWVVKCYFISLVFTAMLFWYDVKLWPLFQFLFLMSWPVGYYYGYPLGKKKFIRKMGGDPGSMSEVLSGVCMALAFTPIWYYILSN